VANLKIDGDSILRSIEAKITTTLNDYTKETNEAKKRNRWDFSGKIEDKEGYINSYKKSVRDKEEKIRRRDLQIKELQEAILTSTKKYFKLQEEIVLITTEKEESAKRILKQAELDRESSRKKAAGFKAVVDKIESELKRQKNDFSVREKQRELKIAEMDR